MSTQRHTNRSDSICMAPNFSDDHTTTPFPFPRLDRRGHQTPRHAAKRRATYAGELVGWPGPSVSFVLRQALGTGARGDLPACLSAARRHGHCEKAESAARGWLRRVSSSGSGPCFGQSVRVAFPLLSSIFVPASATVFDALAGVSFSAAEFVRRLDDMVRPTMCRVGCSVSFGSSVPLPSVWCPSV